MSVNNKAYPSITIVGMASKAMDEAKKRTHVVINNSGLNFPRNK
ncbi:MAG: magnesium chelatase domain-containing protein [Candidatus Saccharibacteria bacterium]